MWGHNAFAGYPEMTMGKKAALIPRELWHKISVLRPYIAVEIFITKVELKVFKILNWFITFVDIIMRKKE